MFKFKKIKYNTSITAKYTGTTMDLRRGYFYINCEFEDEEYKYTFVSEPLLIDPQLYIKNKNIKTFEVLLCEKDNVIDYKKYKVNVDEILTFIEDELNSEE